VITHSTRDTSTSTVLCNPWLLACTSLNSIPVEKILLEWGKGIIAAINMKTITINAVKKMYAFNSYHHKK
jgi:hypothetical protein